MNKPETIGQESQELSDETLEEMIEMLIERVEDLEERLALMEETSALGQPVASAAAPVAVPATAPAGGMERHRSHRRRHRSDPFHGLFGHYFVTGTLLLVFLGVVLALTSGEFLHVSWWLSAIALTLFQVVFLGLGIWQRDKRTTINAAIGLVLAVSIDIGVVQFIGVAPLRDFFFFN
jgi:hypothetical protein